jgi:GT2 family glycosyltransferase
MIDIITASRCTRETFPDSALGTSLRRLVFDERLKPVAFVNNSTGLPALYNSRIDAPNASPYLVFVHDDVWLDDAFLADRVIDALQAYDVVGVAGNRRCAPNHVSWAYPDDSFQWDPREFLSGAVAHGQGPCGAVDKFGAVGPCALLDGVFIAARRDALLRTGVRFDGRFDFHFYDLDFCRSAAQRGLRIGTWPIAITHQSMGGYDSPAWRDALARYRAKWNASNESAVDAKRRAS